MNCITSWACTQLYFDIVSSLVQSSSFFLFPSIHHWGALFFTYVPYLYFLEAFWACPTFLWTLLIPLFSSLFVLHIFLKLHIIKFTDPLRDAWITEMYCSFFPLHKSSSGQKRNDPLQRGCAFSRSVLIASFDQGSIETILLACSSVRPADGTPAQSSGGHSLGILASRAGGLDPALVLITSGH